MTRIIPRELIKHLEWSPEQDILLPPQETPVTRNNPLYGIDEILKGETFFSDEKDSDGNYRGVVVALEEALNHAGEDGIVATMPEFIEAKVQADKNHNFWQRWYTVHTEENIGLDKKGRFYTKDEPVLVVVNGGGILTPDRIRQAYEEGLIGNSAKYTEEEFDNLLEGKLPEGAPLTLHSLEEVKEGISDLPHRFGVVMPYETAKNTESGWHKKKGFLENPLVIARNGGLENIEEFYEKAKDSADDVGNWHFYDSDRDVSVPVGRLLYLNRNYNGLSGGSDLGDNGRFVGVAPEARSALE